MIKIITGIRRCGKSYLLFKLYKQNLLERGVQKDHIIEVNLEDRLNRRLRNPDALLEHIYGRILDSDKYFVLLDEVQMVPEFEDVLNSFLDKENVDVYVTGANAKFLSKDVITEFRGRGWEIRIHPLSFKEYYEVMGGERHAALEQYYLYGGLPAVVLLESPVRPTGCLTMKRCGRSRLRYSVCLMRSARLSSMVTATIRTTTTMAS